ncbi:hypothetical protein QBC35DRAFT_451908 [Podospora australis]|uniref:Uncharacterized protein n=1 Tax=Podospora australis TaxID=1536484 RepID=A0AAN6WT97_9PEZI|nr:hypothetical protein QBC35DRAFT_451908 [Podospora australis]
MSGGGGPGSGALLLKAMPVEEQDGELGTLSNLIGPASDVFLCPFRNIEDIIILYGKSALKERWTVLVIPTRAVAGNSVRYQFPAIVSFSWTGTKLDKDNVKLHGKAVEELTDNRTELEKIDSAKFLMHVLNSELEPRGKKVQSFDLVDMETTTLKGAVDEIKCAGFPATLSYISEVEMKANPSGVLTFYSTGLFFKTKLQTFHFPHRLIERFVFNLKFCGNKVIGMELRVSARKED